MFKLSLFKWSRFKLSLFKLGARSLNLARTASLEAWPYGNILMLLMKPLTAQVGSDLSFPHQCITESLPDTFPHCVKVLHAFMSPVANPF
jgi:hypothetical protein